MDPSRYATRSSISPHLHFPVNTTPRNTGLIGPWVVALNRGPSGNLGLIIALLQEPWPSVSRFELFRHTLSLAARRAQYLEISTLTVTTYHDLQLNLMPTAPAHVTVRRLASLTVVSSCHRLSTPVSSRIRTGYHQRGNLSRHD